MTRGIASRHYGALHAGLPQQVAQQKTHSGGEALAVHMLVDAFRTERAIEHHAAPGAKIKAGKHALVGNSEEEHGGNSLDCQGFESVGGTGEVVSVIGKQRRLCGERLHQAARNLVSAARSSGWNRAYSVNAMPDTAASQACRRLR